MKAADYLKFQPFAKAIGTPKIRIFENEKVKDFWTLIEEEIPLKMADIVSKLPLIGNTK